MDVDVAQSLVCVHVSTSVNTIVVKYSPFLSGGVAIINFVLSTIGLRDGPEGVDDDLIVRVVKVAVSNGS